MKNSAIRLGLIARCDNGGIGSESWEFARHLLDSKDKVLLIRGEHGHYPDRFLEKGFAVLEAHGVPSDNEVDAFLRDIDVLFTIETFYNWSMIDVARSRGIKTVLRLNYEFMPDPRHSPVDLQLSPSQWNLEQITGRVEYLPFPINRDVLPYRNRAKVDSFYHIAGHELYEDRNGTQIFLQAIRFMKSKPPINLFSQHDLSKEALAQYIKDNPNVHCFTEAANYWDVHQRGGNPQGDCLVLPRRYGGQSLQMNEALSTGAMVLMPAVKPQVDFLPKRMMIQPDYARKIQCHGAIVDCYDTDPQKLAMTMDELYGSTITEESEWANDFAESISWDTLGSKYIKLFEGI